MKKLILALTAVAGLSAALGSTTAQAQYRDREVIVERGPKRNLNDGYDRYYNRRRKTVYIIENGRPVRRVVYVDGRGRYYRDVRGEDFYRERVFETFPGRYYYRDGRPRPGISINF